MDKTNLNFTIVIDTREQHPYPFSYPTVTQKLDTGDYSIRGLEDYIAIERKEIDDLALVVEASLLDLANAKYESAMHPQAVIQSLMTFSIRYNLPIFFCGSRTYGQRVTESLLVKYVRELDKRLKGALSNAG